MNMQLLLMSVLWFTNIPVMSRTNQAVLWQDDTEVVKQYFTDRPGQTVQSKIRVSTFCILFLSFKMHNSDSGLANLFRY